MMQSLRVAATDMARELLSGRVEILTMIADDVPALPTLDAIIGLAEKLEPTAIAGVTIADKAGLSLVMAHFPSVPRVFADSLAGAPLTPPYVGTCAQSLSRGEIVTSEDIENDARYSPEWRQLCVGNGIRSCRSFPLRNPEGIALGSFVLCFPEPRTSEEFDGGLIEACATLTEVTLARQDRRDRRALLVDELQHRLTNVLASVGALARFSLHNTTDIEVFRTAFEGRLRAYAIAHSLSLSGTGSDLTILLQQILEPYGVGSRVELTGPRIELAPDAVTSLGMVAHELATNSLKYGALSNDSGKIEIVWDVTTGSDGQGAFVMRWNERGGPPVEPPRRQGFGTRAVERMLAKDIKASAQLSFSPAGFSCVIEAPVGKKLGLPASAGREDRAPGDAQQLRH